MAASGSCTDPVMDREGGVDGEASDGVEAAMAGRRRGRQGRGPDPVGEVEETRKKRSGGAAEDGEVEVEGSGGGSGDVVQGGGIGVDSPIQSGR